MRGSFRIPALVVSALALSSCSSSSSESDSGGAEGQSQAGAGGATAGGGALGTAGAISYGGSGGGPMGGSATAGGAAGSAAEGGASNAGTASGGQSMGGAASSGGASSGAGGAKAGTDPGTAGDGDITVGPTYKASPDLTLKPGAPAGFTTSFTMTSAMSNIYKGDDFSPPQPFSRSIQVFVPQQYVDGAEAPFMVSSDGFYGGLRTVVQNLADDPNPDHRVPPLVIIGIQNGPDTSGRSERSLEYDTVSDRYWQFVTKEVIPAVLSNAALKAKFPNFKLTSDPNGRGGYGCSSGGPAVMGLAWFGDFNRVFSFSGSFVAIRRTTEHPDGAWEYPKLIAEAPLRPNLRVFLEVGENDNNSGDAETTHRNWVIANQNMAAALKTKGNHYRFVFARGANHCDNNARNQVMPEGLIWLWRGYTPG